MSFPHVRKMLYQNPSSGKNYEVVLKLNANGTVDGEGLLLGTNKVNSDPDFNNTSVTFVVLTAKASKVFGEERSGWVSNTALASAAIYDASNRAAAGALLSTLLV